jgi:hypothetical protein
VPCPTPTPPTIPPFSAPGSPDPAVPGFELPVSATTAAGGAGAGSAAGTDGAFGARTGGGGLATAIAFSGSEGSVIYATRLPPLPPTITLPPGRRNLSAAGVLLHSRSPWATKIPTSSRCTAADATKPAYRVREVGSRRLGVTGARVDASLCSNITKGRSPLSRTHARGPEGPRARVQTQPRKGVRAAPPYCAGFLSASRGVNPMIWTPAPRATSIASITS